MNLMNRIIDRNSQILAIQRRYMHRYALLMLLAGLALIAFAVVTYPGFTEFPQFPYFCGFAGCVFVIFGILMLRRKEQLPDPDEQKP